MSEWTPRPWAVAYDDHNGQAVVSGEHTEVCTCWHHSVGSLEKQMRRNAHLIAAAPDLYEALRRLEKNGHRQATWDFALKAMAKARGEAQ